MLTHEMTLLLNDQLNLEIFSANLYLQMSAWCKNKGFDGAYSFLKMHSREEMEHMQRLFDYLNDAGRMPILNSLEAPPNTWDSLYILFENALKHEKFISNKINELTHRAITTHDYSTFNFLQWYISEQREEEQLFNTIISKLIMIGNKGEGLLIFDRDLAHS